jgi:hypothetical protein
MAELDKEAKRLANKDDPSGTAFGRNKQVPDRKVKHLLNLLLRLDMNVIITSHAKGEWKNGAPTGTDTFDCYARLDYLFDLVFQIQKRGKDRVGIVRKTRCIGFEEGEVFPFSYEEIADKYGREVLERKPRGNSGQPGADCGDLTAGRSTESPATPLTSGSIRRRPRRGRKCQPRPLQSALHYLNNSVAGTAAAQLHRKGFSNEVYTCIRGKRRRLSAERRIRRRG